MSPGGSHFLLYPCLTSALLKQKQQRIFLAKCLGNNNMNATKASEETPTEDLSGV